MRSVVLIHGGFHPMNDAEEFWVAPGVVEGLTSSGFQVLAPNRAAQPCSWRAEGRQMAAVITQHSGEPAILVAGSNGCSVAVRAAVDHQRLVSALVLCWPATAGDPNADALGRRAFADLEVPSSHVDEILRGETLRGVTDHELRQLTIPVVVVPSDPFNPTHQKHTVDRLVDLIPTAAVVGGFPETPTPLFPPRRSAFLAELSATLTTL